jgi:hypothetical protein
MQRRNGEGWRWSRVVTRQGRSQERCEPLGTRRFLRKKAPLVGYLPFPSRY